MLKTLDQTSTNANLTTVKILDIICARTDRHGLWIAHISMLYIRQQSVCVYA